MTIIAGDANYTAIIATSVTSNAPAGDLVYLYAKDWDYGYANATAQKPGGMGITMWYPSGKRQLALTLKTVYVVAQVESYATDEINAILDFLYQHTLKIGSTPIYLFLLHMADTAAAGSNKYLKPSWNTNHTQLPYMKGFVDKLTATSARGQMYILPSVSFVEANNG